MNLGSNTKMVQTFLDSSLVVSFIYKIYPNELYIFLFISQYCTITPFGKMMHEPIQTTQDRKLLAALSRKKLIKICFSFICNDCIAR